MENKPEHMRKLFWVLWSVLLIFLPFYLFSFLFAIGDINTARIASMIPAMIGGFTVITQIFVHVTSFKQADKGLSLSTHYLTLLVGTALVALIWLAGCFLLGTCGFL